MIISSSIIIVSLILDGLLSNFLNFMVLDLSLFTPLFTVMSLFIIYPFFHKREKFYYGYDRSYFNSYIIPKLSSVIIFSPSSSTSYPEWPFLFSKTFLINQYSLYGIRTFTYSYITREIFRIIH